MSRFSWRFLKEGMLGVDLGYIFKMPSVKTRATCQVKLMHADRGRGGILYVYPNPSVLNHYVVISFSNISIRESWFDNNLSIDVILDFEPITFTGTSSKDRQEWISAFATIQSAQHSAIAAAGRGAAVNESSRLSVDDLMASDVAMHFGEHLCLKSRTNAALSLGAVPDTADTIILNNRAIWTDVPRHPVVVIEDLVHNMQALYGFTSEGQRRDIEVDSYRDEWYALADSMEFNLFIEKSSELQCVDLSLLESPDERNKFFLSMCSLLSMHAAGALKLSFREVLFEYDKRIAYLVGGEVFTLQRVTDLCNPSG
jgi:hypothetical protein